MTRDQGLSWLGLGLLPGVVLPAPSAAYSVADLFQVLGEPQLLPELDGIHSRIRGRYAERVRLPGRYVSPVRLRGRAN